MKIFLAFAVTVLVAAAGLAQQAPLPDILATSALTEATASASGARALKLLPRGMFDAKEPSYQDEENPLGIRGGGAYYSFTSGLHSYNKIPQIELQRGYLSAGGFYGLNYGFIKDLGNASLGSVTEQLPELEFLLTYVPPHLIPEVRSEQGKRANYLAKGSVYRSSLPVRVGNTYALRSISYNEADVLVAFTVLAKNDDDSIEMIWKPIRTFQKPVPWYLSDKEMEDRLVAILSSNAAYVGITGSVHDNVISLEGKANQQAIWNLLQNIHQLRSVEIKNAVKIVQPVPR